MVMGDWLYLDAFTLVDGWVAPVAAAGVVAAVFRRVPVLSAGVVLAGVVWMASAPTVPLWVPLIPVGLGAMSELARGAQ